MRTMGLGYVDKLLGQMHPEVHQYVLVVQRILRQATLEGFGGHDAEAIRAEIFKALENVSKTGKTASDGEEILK